ncbi:MFS transporter [Pseudooceanicola sp. C21-150M6]|uniref:MFS transporter n=1 Tax=Pseudooceanicola sp. C21-150M6 TaxID=3434355 RepID=UPI003D7F4A44
MKLFALMLAPLAFTTGVFVFAGVLGPMAEDLGVSVGHAGQLQSAFAVTCAISGPILAILTGRLGRKGILVATMAYMAVMNALSAQMPSFGGLLTLRILAGAFGALALPMASTIAVALVGPERRARALAVIYGGVSLAFLSGVPVGSIVGEAYGWRASFLLAAALCAFACLMVLVFVPKVPAPPPMAKGAFAAVLRWPTTGYLLVTMLAFAAIFSAIGYVGPVVTKLTGFSGPGVGAVQMISGLGSILGLTIGTRMVEGGARRPLIWLFATIFVAQGIFAAGLIGGAYGGLGLAVAVIAMAFGSTSLFGTAPIVQTRLAQAAGPAATLAFALNGSMVYLGQGTGVILGGLMLGARGLDYVSTAGMAVAVVGLLLAWALRTRTQTLAPAPS